MVNKYGTITLIIYNLHCCIVIQIISPVDKGIASEIKKNLEPLDSSWDTTALYGHQLLRDGLEEVCQLYMSRLPLLKINRPIPKCPAVYTAMHGVGWKYIQRAFKTAGYPEPIPVNTIIFF